MNKNALALVIFLFVAIGAFIVGKNGFTFSQYQNSDTNITPTADLPQNLNIQPATQVTPVQSDWDELPTSIKGALIAKYGPDAELMKVTVSEIQGGFAKGTASSTTDGGLWFAAKIDGKWHLVWDGNGVVECNALDQFPGFPNSLVSECFDSSSNTMVTR